MDAGAEGGRGGSGGGVAEGLKPESVSAIARRSTAPPAARAASPRAPTAGNVDARRQGYLRNYMKPIQLKVAAVGNSRGDRLPSAIAVNQIRTVSTSRIGERLGMLSDADAGALRRLITEMYGE